MTKDAQLQSNSPKGDSIVHVINVSNEKIAELIDLQSGKLKLRINDQTNMIRRESFLGLLSPNGEALTAVVVSSRRTMIDNMLNLIVKVSN
ncbi:hypothetical protein [Paenibacillus ihuae]|uniref:hypothetical protein n=1 Tax=Paenibacillus ihuae TaxID=1232431 RepID=UPI0006D536F7|nr:hypothetical protein [Paenibacillus ihuae]